MSNTLMRTLALAGTLLIGLAAVPAEAAHGRHGHGGGHRGFHHGHGHGFGHGGRHHAGWHGGRRFHAWRGGPGRPVFVGRGGRGFVVEHRRGRGWYGPGVVYGAPYVRRVAAYGGGPGPGCSTRRSVGWAPGGWHKIVTVRTCIVP